MIYNRLFEGKSSIENVIEHLMLKNSDAPYINQLLKKFISMDWLSPEKDPYMNPLTEYTIHPRIIRSVLGDKMIACEIIKLENSYDLLSSFQQKMIKRKERKITYEELTEWSIGLIDNHNDLEISQFIKEKALEPFEKIMFLNLASEHYNGNEEFDVDDIIKQILPPKELRYRLRNDLQAKEHVLINTGLIEEIKNDSGFNFIDQCKFRLTENAVRSFDKEYKSKRNTSGSILVKKEYESVIDTKLLFDKSVQKMVNKLGEMLNIEKFKELQGRMQNKGMKAGITVLLYGLPGTGKTETVLQLARNNGRNIMMVEANRIRSKWVGETEKNIKKVFEEYKSAMKNEKCTPILLFNEADAIIGKRHEINDRGDQMENSMQNIILEELENFEGIFMATTNLVENFDKAFDRRFLYKLKLEKPTEEIMVKIWKTKFPEIKTGIIKNICQQFSLSGGQIENIRKKLLVDSVLSEKQKIDEKYLIELIDKEMLGEKKDTRERVMGFLR
jgi:hypothetical protein